MVVAVEVFVPVTGWLAPLERLVPEGRRAALSGHGAIDVVLALPALMLAGSLIAVMSGCPRVAAGPRCS